MQFKKAVATVGIGLALTFALGACDVDDDDVNGDTGDVDVTTTILETTTTIIDTTTTSG